MALCTFARPTATVSHLFGVVGGLMNEFPEGCVPKWPVPLNPRLPDRKKNCTVRFFKGIFWQKWMVCLCECMCGCVFVWYNYTLLKTWVKNSKRWQVWCISNRKVCNSEQTVSVVSLPVCLPPPPVFNLPFMKCAPVPFSLCQPFVPCVRACKVALLRYNFSFWFLDHFQRSTLALHLWTVVLMEVVRFIHLCASILNLCEWFVWNKCGLSVCMHVWVK